MALNRVMIFAKAPVPGRVKTRMLPYLSPSQAARLQELMIARSLLSCCQQGPWSTELWCAPDTKHKFFQELALCYSVKLKEQRGIDLGERMAAAFVQNLNAGDFSVVIGTDCPALNAEHIALMFQKLAAGMDAVIIPAIDGGYVALGLRTFAPDLFTAVPWGGNQVYLKTIERMDMLGWRWCALPALWDVDRPDDYLRLENSGLIAELPLYLAGNDGRQ